MSFDGGEGGAPGSEYPMGSGVGAGEDAYPMASGGGADSYPLASQPRPTLQRQDSKFAQAADSWMNSPQFKGSSFFQVEMDEAERANIAMEVAAYEQRTGKKLRKNSQGLPENQYKGYFMKVTFLIITLMLGIEYLLSGISRFEFANNPLLSPDQETLVDMGAKEGSRMSDGEWYRFVTPIFLHGGVLHWGFNMYLQLTLGLQLEKLFGPLRIGIIYMLAGISGNLMSVVFLPQVVSVGASGSLFGLIGIVFMDLVQNWGVIKNPCKQTYKTLLQTGFALLMGLLPVIDNFAHIGGFLAGALLTPIMLPSQSRSKKWKTVLVLVCIPVFLILWMVGFALFYNNVNGNAWCPICAKLNCVDIPGQEPWCPPVE